MTRPVLIMQLRPEDATSDSEFAALLRYSGLAESEVERLRIEHTGIPADLDLENYSALIVGGSPFDISTPQHLKPAIQVRIEQDFKRLFDFITANDFPFLGACSGSGLLGAYLGTPITTRYREAIGCVTLEVTEAGKQDHLLAGFPDRVAVLLGHKEGCESVPDGAVLLLTGAACPVQMFRVGNNVYATQFHPEGDPQGFALRINVYKHHGYFEPDEAEALIERVRQAETPYAQAILHRFVSRYTSREY